MSKQPASPPPAYFLSLSLENVRSFGEKQTISFAQADGRPTQWTIILGDNGVGKTTVLKALAGVAPLNEFHEIARETQSYRKNPLIFRWNALRHHGQKNAVISFSSCIHSLFTVINSDPDNINYGEMMIEVIRTPTQYPAIGLSDATIDLSGLVCYGYGASRSTGTTTLVEASDHTDTCASLFDDNTDLENPEEWFLQMDYASLKEKSKNNSAVTIIEQVRQALLLVLPDVTDIQIKTTKRKQQQLELETPYGWVRLRDMSLGYQTLVVWLTDFASKLFIRYPDSPNPLEEPAIVLIDEIDLHLHPSWQRKLIGFLSGIFKNTQFIATAHSPLVVQAAGDANANVILLKREGDQTVVYQNPEDVRGWRIDQILTSSFFNLETARSLETEKKLERQAKLLNKVKLTAKERQELDALTLELEGQPMGSTGAEEEEAKLLRQIAERLGTNPRKPAAQ